MMKIQQTPRDDHQVEVVVELEKEQLENARHRAARKLAGRGKIPGFRPGKAPYPVVLRHYGEGPITEEAIEILVDETYPKMLEEAAIQPAAAGSLENVEQLDPPTFKFLVPLRPEVDLGDYRSIRLAYEWEAPGEEKVDEAIEQLRTMYGKTETVEREVQDGDFVMLDVHGEVTGVAEGEEASDLSRDGFPVMVRKEEREDEWPFPGFTQKLLGMKPGDVRNFTHDFPADVSEEALRGKAAKFDVTVKTVRAVALPELNDDFAKTAGTETVDELRQRVRENIERQSRDEYDDKYFVQIFDLIKEGATIKYPPQVLDHESEHVLEELKRRLGEQRMDLETYIKVRNTDMDAFMAEEVKPTAQRRLERSLLIDEIAHQEKIELSEQELTEAFTQYWSALSANDEQFHKITKGGTRGSKDMVNAVALDAANRTIVSRVLDHLKAIATGQAGAEEQAADKRTPEGGPAGEQDASAPAEESEPAPQPAEEPPSAPDDPSDSEKD
jgi:trigger factor